MYWISAIAVSASRCRLAKLICTSRRTCGTVTAADCFPQKAALPHQEVMRQQRHGHLVMPAAPVAHLILIHAHFALALLDRRLDRPAHAALAHPRGMRRRGRG